MPLICRLCSEKVSRKALYKKQAVPVLNNVVYDSEKLAAECETGSISLVQCHRCGLIFNCDYDENRITYDSRYDSSRYHSPVYSGYLDYLAGLFSERLTCQSRIIEIGCGNGDFLKKLSDLSGCHAEGYDGSYLGPPQYGEKVLFSRDTFVRDGRGKPFSMLILRHVLEHIPDLSRFFKTISQSLPFTDDSVLLIEVPDFEWIVREKTYFDITYEHCNYFLKSTLAECAAQMGFKLSRTMGAYQNQYIIFEGERAGKHQAALQFTRFTEKDVGVELKAARRRLVEKLSSHRDILIWGASGKGAIFLSDLPGYMRKRVKCAIDINPSKQGSFLPYSGKRIVSPAFLKSIRDRPTIIIMNEVYQHEIEQQIAAMGISASLMLFREMRSMT
ncbi:MAG: class I SAM-dependent methyltransferase [Candidatus Xenobiia bacterium LiM19]